MRTTESFAWRPILFSLAIGSLVGMQACSSAPRGRSSDEGGASGENGTATGGKGGSGTGGKAATGGAGGTGGKMDAGAAGSGPDASTQGGSGGSAGSGGKGGSGGSGGSGGTGGSGGKGGSGGSGGSGGTGGSAGTGGGGAGGMGPPAGAVNFGKHVLTWYTFQDNTPVNSLFSGSGRPLRPFSSVAVPRRELRENGGKLAYGDKIWLSFLAGRKMPNNTTHTGWVQVDDFCGDAGDDTYCYQQIPQGRFPNVDIYIGDFSKTGMTPAATGDCPGPAGSGQELTDVYTGNAGANFRTDYGGAAIGTGKCGDKPAARREQKGTTAPGEGGCWGYDGQDSADACSNCTPSTCAP